MKVITIENCTKCPFHITLRGNYSNYEICGKTKQKVGKIIPENCPLQNNNHLFTAYTFHIKTEDVKYYTDKRMPYTAWYDFLTEVQECTEIDSLTLWDIFNKSISTCGIKMVFPVSEEYYTFTNNVTKFNKEEQVKQ